MSHSRKLLSHERLSHSPSSQESNSHDWICLKCNNLNFSFRKKCNRCKVQSRQDNEQLLYADYYYYNQYYAYQDIQAPPRQQTQNHLNDFIEAPHSPKKKMYESEGDPAEAAQREDDHLPSVSPLVKRYGSGKAKKSVGNRSLFVWKLFGQESWSEGELPALTSPQLSKDLSLTDDQDTNYDFIRSVQKMII